MSTRAGVTEAMSRLPPAEGMSNSTVVRLRSRLTTVEFDNLFDAICVHFRERTGRNPNQSEMSAIIELRDDSDGEEEFSTFSKQAGEPVECVVAGGTCH